MNKLLEPLYNILQQRRDQLLDQQRNYTPYMDYSNYTPDPEWLLKAKYYLSPFFNRSNVGQDTRIIPADIQNM